jgi:hypothetical protein
MKQVKSILIIALTVVGLMACQKEEGGKAMSGTWVGYWGFDFETPDIYERWEMEKNGDFSVYNSNGSKFANGTWHVDGFNFTAEYTTVTSQNTYLFDGLYSDAAGELTGNWGQKPSSTNGGTFIMHKQ